MATTLAPYGLRPISLIGGQPFAGSTRLMKINNAYASNIFYGQPVTINAAGYIAAETGTTTIAATGVVGVFVGCTYTDPNLNIPVWKQYWPASTSATDAYAYVVDDPDVVMQIQADGAVAQSALGDNIALGTAGGSTITGNANTVATQSSIATTATLPLRIVGFSTSPEDSVGDTYTNILVKWNMPTSVSSNASNATVTMTYGHAYMNPVGA